MSRFFFAKTLFLALAAFSFIIPVGVSAQTSASPVAGACECFCGDTNVGAVPSGKMLSQDCPAFCNGISKRAIICTNEIAEFPDNNLRCYSSEECAAQGGIFDRGQATECKSGDHYCYPQPVPYTLAVSIGGKNQVLHIGEYINTGYKWALNAGIVFAVIMMMIGGLQYVVASGYGDTSSAKKRITNAVIGFILLLLTYLILSTVNPNLTKLDVPKLPMLKQVLLISDATTCEDLLDATKTGGTYVLEEPEAAKQSCGGQAKVLTDPQGQPVVNGSLCNYSLCTGTDKGKFCYGSGAAAGCYACTDVYAGSGEGPRPSENVCKVLGKNSFSDQSIHGAELSAQYCAFTRDADVLGITDILLNKIIVETVTDIGQATSLISRELSGEAASAFDTGSCIDIGLDCGKIKDCSDYLKVPVNYTQDRSLFREAVNAVTGSSGGGAVEKTALGNIEPGFGNSLTIREMCSVDPCGVAKKSGADQAICFYRSIDLEAVTRTHTLYTRDTCELVTSDDSTVVLDLYDSAAEALESISPF